MKMPALPRRRRFMGRVSTTERLELTLRLMGPYNQQDHIVPSVRSFARLCVSPSIHSLYRPKPLSGAIIVGLPIATPWPVRTCAMT